MKKYGRVEVYRRPDGKWDWRLVASNGQIVATSGGQGYNRPGRAEQKAWEVCCGDYRVHARRMP